MQEAVRFVVYRFNKGQNIDLNNAAAIQTITGGTTFDIPKQKGKWIWVVTALDRCWNESAPVSIK